MYSTAMPTAGTFQLSDPVYEDYNRATAVCSYGPGPFEGILLFKMNDDIIELPLLEVSKKFDNGCAIGTITRIGDNCNSSTPRCTWNASLVLRQGCDRVQLQCGHSRSSGRPQLSNVVTTYALQSKMFVCSCAMQYIHIMPHTQV